MDANEDAGLRVKPGVFESIASKLALAMQHHQNR